MAVSYQNDYAKSLLKEMRVKFTKASSPEADKKLFQELNETIDAIMADKVCQKEMPNLPNGLRHELLKTIEIEIQILEGTRKSLGENNIIERIQLRHQMNYLLKLKEKYEIIDKKKDKRDLYKETNSEDFQEVQELDKQCTNFDMKVKATKDVYTAKKNEKVDAIMSKCFESLEKLPGCETMLDLEGYRQSKNYNAIAEQIDFIEKYEHDDKLKARANDYLARLKVRHDTEEEIRGNINYINYLKAANHNVPLLIKYLRIKNKGSINDAEKARDKAETKYNSMGFVTSIFNQSEKKQLKSKVDNLNERIETIKSSEPEIAQMEETLIKAGLGPILKAFENPSPSGKTVEDKAAIFIRAKLSPTAGLPIAGPIELLEKQNKELGAKLTRINENIAKYKMQYMNKQQTKEDKILANLSYDQLNFISLLEKTEGKGNIPSPLNALHTLEALDIIQNIENVESLGEEHIPNYLTINNVRERCKIFEEERKEFISQTKMGIDSEKIRALQEVQEEIQKHNLGNEAEEIETVARAV